MLLLFLIVEIQALLLYPMVLGLFVIIVLDRLDHHEVVREPARVAVASNTTALLLVFAQNFNLLLVLLYQHLYFLLLVLQLFSQDIRALIIKVLPSVRYL